MEIDYQIGDPVVSKQNPDCIIGICTGFTHDDTCIEIDGKVYGGKNYFKKADFIDVEFEILT